MDEIRHLGSERIGDYAEGLLAPAERASADAHLASCEACRRDLAAAQAYFGEMASLPVHRAPDRFLSHVHARIDKASAWKRFLALLSSPRLLPVPLGALSVILIGVWFAVIQRGGEEAPRVAYQAAREDAPAPVAAAPEAEKSVGQPATGAVGGLARSDGADLAELKAKADRSPPKVASLRKGAREEASGEPVMTPMKERAYTRASPPEDPEALAKIQAPSRLSGRRGKTTYDETGLIGTELADAGSAKDKKNSGAGSIAANSAGGTKQGGEVGALASADVRERQMPAEKPAAAPKAEASKRMEKADSDDEPLAMSRPRSQKEHDVASYSQDADTETESLEIPASPSASRPAPVVPIPRAAQAPVPAPDYILVVEPGRISQAALRQEIKTMGIQASNSAYGKADLWDLSIPPPSLRSLEAYLKTLGKFQVLSKPGQPPLDGAPHRRLLRVTFPR